MKENKYDQERFFEKYAQMSRSKEGLIAAGEWDTLRRVLPDLGGKTLLDLGCGYGWHCIYAMEQGASRAVGVDISQKMLDIARDKTSFEQVEYIRAAMEDFEAPAAAFDVVLSSLALHYIADFEAVSRRVYHCLKPGGSFVFSVEHPIFTSYGTQDWYRGVDGEVLHFPVDNYFYEGQRVASFLGEDVVKYHRTLTSYLNGLLSTGFELREVVEPQPSQQMIDTIAGMRDELRRPMMLIVSAVKR